jgi:DNA modification methylase
MADYVLLFRAPGENAEPVDTDVTNEEWIQWARPVWYGIRETNTLNVRDARSQDDERHICPLQLDLIKRCVRLWSNPRDVVLSPFAGIGSEGFVSVKLGRRFVGMELKEEYYRIAVENLKHAEQLALGELFAPSEV